MSMHKLSMINLHSSLHMAGKNFGLKIDTKNIKCLLVYDDVRNVVWIRFNNHISAIPSSNIASQDMLELPKDVIDFLGNIPEKIVTQEKAKMTLEIPSDPNDPEYHRAMVRAASASPTKPNPLAVQNDLLIQEARNAAAGVKQNRAQVSNPTLPTEGATGVKGKSKAISHAQLKAQVAAEAKESI